MTIFTTIAICAIVSVVVSTAVFYLLSTDEVFLDNKFSKLWSRVQKADSKVDRISRDVSALEDDIHFHEHRLDDRYRAESHMMSILGIDEMHFNDIDQQTLITYKTGKKDLINWNDMKIFIPLKEVSTNKAVIDFKGRAYSYNKPVSTEF